MTMLERLAVCWRILWGTTSCVNVRERIASLEASLADADALIDRLGKNLAAERLTRHRVHEMTTELP